VETGFEGHGFSPGVTIRYIETDRADEPGPGEAPLLRFAGVLWVREVQESREDSSR
jgi:hypothetical protein